MNVTRLRWELYGLADKTALRKGPFCPERPFVELYFYETGANLRITSQHECLK